MGTGLVDPDGAALASPAGAVVNGSGDEYPGGGPPYLATTDVTSPVTFGALHPASTITEPIATAASLELVRVVRQNGQVTSAARR
ncbi:MAG: hypothetical protein FWD73_17955 [Polyangiaceae bacterium]|nr:hypothetical protein [Polyangiaceae bacterium]